MLDAEGRRLLAWRESVTDPPNVFLHDLGRGEHPSGSRDLPDPAPSWPA